MIMDSKNELREELKKIAPDFPERQRTSPPEGYFTELPEKIISRWKQEAPVRKPLSPWRKIAGIAAIIAALLIAGLWLIPNRQSSNHAGITALEAYQYIHENINEFEGLIETGQLTEDLHQLDVPREEIEEFLIEEMSDSEAEELF